MCRLLLLFLLIVEIAHAQGDENADNNYNSIRGSDGLSGYKNFTLPSIDAPDLLAEDATEESDSEDGDYSNNLDSLDPEGAVPIHKSVISYLFASLETNECYNLCVFLSSQTDNVSETQYELACEIIQTDLGIIIIPEDFECKGFLKKWNEVIIPGVIDHNADNLFYARGLLEVGLSKVDRSDLSNYVKEYYGAQIKSEVRKFNKVLLGRRIPSFSQLSFTHFHSNHSTTEEPELLLTWTQWIWKYYLQIGLSFGIFVVGIILNCVIIYASSKINPSKKMFSRAKNMGRDDEKQRLLIV